MYFKPEGDISTLSGKTLDLVDQFTYPGSNIPSMENDVGRHQLNAKNFIHRLLIIWKSYLSDKINPITFQLWQCQYHYIDAQYEPLTKRIENKLDGINPRILRSVLNKCWKKHSIEQQLYGHLHFTLQSIPAK